MEGPRKLRRSNFFLPDAQAPYESCAIWWILDESCLNAHTKPTWCIQQEVYQLYDGKLTNFKYY